MKNVKKMIPMMLIMLIIVVSGSVFALQGVSMHAQVEAEEETFHQLQANYFSLAKATRDTAEANSELNSQLVQIQNYPSTLLQLKLVGVGKILTGIFILLFGILIALVAMPIRLGKIIKE